MEFEIKNHARFHRILDQERSGLSTTKKKADLAVSLFILGNEP